MSVGTGANNGPTHAGNTTTRTDRQTPQVTTEKSVSSDNKSSTENNPTENTKNSNNSERYDFGTNHVSGSDTPEGVQTLGGGQADNSARALGHTTLSTGGLNINNNNSINNFNDDHGNATDCNTTVADRNAAAGDAGDVLSKGAPTATASREQAPRSDKRMTAARTLQRAERARRARPQLSDPYYRLYSVHYHNTSTTTTTPTTTTSTCGDAQAPPGPGYLEGGIPAGHQVENLPRARLQETVNQLITQRLAWLTEHARWVAQLSGYRQRAEATAASDPAATLNALAVDPEAKWAREQLRHAERSLHHASQAVMDKMAELRRQQDLGLDPGRLIYSGGLGPNLVYVCTASPDGDSGPDQAARAGPDDADSYSRSVAEAAVEPDDYAPLHGILPISFEYEEDWEDHGDSGTPESTAPATDPTTTADDAQDFFVRHVTEELDPDAPRFDSTHAYLDFHSGDGERVRTDAIVDSGAARCACRAAWLRSKFPEAFARLRPTSERFRDASGNLMTLEGTVDLYLCLGSHCMRVQVYAFRELSAQFLLGTCALYRNGMNINYHKGRLEAPRGGDDASAELMVHRRPRANLTAPLTLAPPCSDTCACTSAPADTSLSCDLDRCVLELRVAGAVEHSIPCRTAADPIDAHQVHRGIATRSICDLTIPDGENCHIVLAYDQALPDVETIELTTAEWVAACGLTSVGLQYHHSFNRNAFLRVKNCSGRAIKIPAGSTVCWAKAIGRGDGRLSRTRRSSATSPQWGLKLLRSEAAFEDGGPPKDQTDLRSLGFDLEGVDRREWYFSEAAPGEGTAFDAPSLASLLEERLLASPGTRVPLTAEECSAHVPDEITVDHYLLVPGLGVFRPTATTIDPDVPTADGGWAALSRSKRDRLYTVALDWWICWSRDAKVPEISRLVVIDIPTGDTLPIAQKPYPIPYVYLEAARKEVQKLLDGGLIEPSLSSWASPTLVRVKKDSTPDDPKIKLVIDFRRLNQATVPDAGGLGTQEEIIHGFGGRQRFGGLMDAAGGFYQFMLNPEHQHKTAFVLPTALGGTLFQWRVAPYGLTRNPAGYSRGMMFALQGLDHVRLGPFGEDSGGAKSWIDDISMHADSFDGFVELFRLLLGRVAASGMSLKGTKCHLLRARLELLGFLISPDGVRMQPEKLTDLHAMQPPRSIKDIQVFLGAVNFYRRFLPRLALLAAPMNALMKKDARARLTGPDRAAELHKVEQSFRAILDLLTSSAVVSCPDLADPLAEYVLVTDACDVAVGGALLQWQHPSGQGPGPPEGTPVRGATGRADPISESWRLEAGWKLRVIGYFSRTLDSAQQNYPTFDKEAGAILLCVRHWAQLITHRYTTVYTDSTVAVSMLTKHFGQPRLQRWGMELGTYLPFLKVAYRKGELNGLADLVSRYPVFDDYVEKRAYADHVLPPDALETPIEVPFFLGNHEPSRDYLKSSVFRLATPRDKPKPFWEGVQHPQEAATGEQWLNVVWEEVKSDIAHHPFHEEQRRYEDYQADWQQYVDVFQSTLGRAPVLYDLFCGEGGFSRGAREVGCQCIGFDFNKTCADRYENEPYFLSEDAAGDKISSGMVFVEADVSSDSFWEELRSRGRIGDHPPPDIIHASPPCSPITRLAKINAETQAAAQRTPILVNETIRRLQELEHAWGPDHPVTWQVENVPESRHHVSTPVPTVLELCGTMMGHRVFRHRLFYCNYEAEADLPHSHEGKWVGSHGVSFAANHATAAEVDRSNMWGVYSRRSNERGTDPEWHGAMGFAHGTFSRSGLVNALPHSYGRLLAAQQVAHLLHRQYSIPIWRPADLNDERRATLTYWSSCGWGRSEARRYRDLTEDEWNADTLLSFGPPPNPPAEGVTDDPPLLAAGGNALAEGVVDGPPPPPGSMDASAEGVTMADPDGTPDSAVASRPASQRRPWRPSPPSDVAIAGPTAFAVSRQQQLTDPGIAFIMRALEHNVKRHSSSLPLNFCIRDGLLRRRAITALGEVREAIVVPESMRDALMNLIHYSLIVGHTGHEKMVEWLRPRFWWYNLDGDCVAFCKACEKCSGLRSESFPHPLTQTAPTPGRPFQVIHIDYKGPLRRSGKNSAQSYSYILIVTCALTRYTLYIPTSDCTGDTTLQALVGRCFSVFGLPRVIVSDNGTSFRNGLMAAAARFYGYRAIQVLPYNASGNGVAESAVKRIKTLLDRHTIDYHEWHRLLPHAQLMLNTTTSSALGGMSPFAALFGYEPFGLAELENPELLPADGEGEEFLVGVRARMLRIHHHLRILSDRIKEANVDAKNERIKGRLTQHSTGGDISPGDFVWIQYGDKEKANYLRKYGHGEPWKHRYRVRGVTNHAILLEIPDDGSVPRINQWQLLRRCSLSAPELHCAPHVSVAADGTPVEGSPPAGNDEEAVIPGPGDVGDAASRVRPRWEVDHIVRAEPSGSGYALWVKWKGDEYPDPTREPLASLRASATRELRKEIDAAIAKAQGERPRAPPRPAAPPRPTPSRELPRRLAKGCHPHGSLSAVSATDADGLMTLVSMVCLARTCWSLPAGDLAGCSAGISEEWASPGERRVGDVATPPLRVCALAPYSPDRPGTMLHWSSAPWPA